MEILKPEDLKEKFDDPWIAPYDKEITMVDGDVVEIVEYHPCISGSHWLVNQYKHSSQLITNAYRDGNKHVFTCKIGNKPIDLQASYNAAGIESIEVDDDEVKVVHTGLAGAGVGAAMCRGMAEGVKRVELIEEGGGSKVGKAAVITPRMEKLVIGIDDTDIKNKGATWTTAHNIGLKLKSEGFAPASSERAPCRGRGCSASRRTRSHGTCPGSGRRRDPRSRDSTPRRDSFQPSYR